MHDFEVKKNKNNITFITLQHTDPLSMLNECTSESEREKGAIVQYPAHFPILKFKKVLFTYD